jgi:hypothetical protein
MTTLGVPPAVYSRLLGDFSHEALEVISGCRAYGGWRPSLRALDAFIQATRRAGAAVSPLTLYLHEWCGRLSEDHDAPYVLQGLVSGFDWPHGRPSGWFHMPNGVKPELEERVHERILAMVAAGELIRRAPAQVRCISGLCCVPKGEDDFRLIHNLSAPHGDSVNDAQHAVAISFTSVRRALCEVRAGGFLAKVDISNAYVRWPTRAPARSARLGSLR